MSAAERIAPWISEPLTWAEICERYPDEWVCLVELESNPDGADVSSARVVGHSKTQKDALAQCRPWWRLYPAVGVHLFFIGQMKYPLRTFPRIEMTDASEYVAVSAAQQIAPWVSERLTWAEICARYPDEWVWVVEIEDEPNSARIRAARVIGHGSSRQSLEHVDAWRERYPLIGHFFTGKIKPRSRASLASW